MELKKLKPINNSSRHTIKIQKNLLSKNNKIIRSILSKKMKSHGRSSINGRITVRHKGSGVKHLYRNIYENINDKTNNNLLVLANCYDPNRHAFINLNFDLKKKNFSYSTAPEDVFPGSLIKGSNNFQNTSLGLGYRTQLKNIPAGSLIHNITLKPNKNSKYVRAAGTCGQIIQCGLTTAKIKLPSKKIIDISSNNQATIGIVSNIQQNLTIIGKAGVNRRLGVRPTVRGIAMNPVDHPHGGRTNGGMPSVSPWGLPTKGGYYLRKKRKV